LSSSAFDRERFAAFESHRDFVSGQSFALKQAKKAYVPESCSRVGFKVRTYSSGEVTGAQFSTGLEGKNIPPVRYGALISKEFTRPAKIKIRRAVENSVVLLGKFCTLTFAPSCLNAWELNENGSVRHDFAKYKLKNFLSACYMKQRRLKRELNYLWTAELQENTGNIHFHILWDKFFDIKWLSKVWNQENNSVDITRMKNPVHAARYMAKYMTKNENNEIGGKRYDISAGLRKTMIPVEKIIFEMTKQEATYSKDTVGELRSMLHVMEKAITARGGIVMDFGFSIPMGRASKEYRVANDVVKRTKGVDPRLGKWVKTILTETANHCSLQVAPF